MILIGVDYSITSPAITVFNQDSGELRFICFRQKKKDVSLDSRVNMLEMPVYGCEQERHHLLSTKLFEAAVGCFGAIGGAYMENYAYAGSGQVFNIAEATGCFKQLLFRNGIPLDVFQPTSVKKVATGKGNAKKHEMLAQFTKDVADPYPWFGRVYAGEEKIISPVSDIVDSYYVLKTGLAS